MLPAARLDADVAVLVAALQRMVRAEGLDLVQIHSEAEFLEAVRSMETYRRRGAKVG